MAKLKINDLNGNAVIIDSDEVYQELLKGGASNYVIRNTIEEIVEFQNEMQEHGKYKEALEWDEAVQYLVALYTGNAKYQAYKEFLDSDNPLLSAVMKMTIDVIKVSSSTDKKTRITSQKVVDSSIPIDLVDFEKRAREDHQVHLGYSRGWLPQIERLNYIYTIRAGRELGDPKYDAQNLTKLHDNYIMSKVAKDLAVNEADVSRPQLLSNRQLLRELNEIGQKMFGPEFKFNSHDVSALYGSYKGGLQVGKSKDGNYAKITVPSTRKMVERVMIACNRVFNDGRYRVESSQFKKEK